MKALTALATALVAVAAFTALVFVYLKFEGPNKARLEGLMIQLPAHVEWRIKIHDWIARFWHLPAFAILVGTYFVTLAGLRRRDEEVRPK